MAFEQDLDLEVGVTRLLNRALRTVNRNLRKKVTSLEEKSDQEFLAVCETETLAEQAMRKLWEKAGLSCSPQDYDTIVEAYVNEIFRSRKTVTRNSPKAAATV